MIPSNPIPAVCNYASSATYCTCPSDAQVANGVVPLDSLPAAWWNWMWAKTNESVNCARGAAGALITEINNVLTQAGVCPNPSCTDQLYQAIDRLRQTIGNSVTAGAVKSSSCPSEVAIDANGYMSVNCLGNAANLTTSATTIVGAINELKCTYDCCISDITSNITDLQNCKAPKMHASCETTYGVGNATAYGHLKISDVFSSCVGSVAEGVAASQKALYDAYTCLSNMPVTFAECACCIYVCSTVPSGCNTLYPMFVTATTGYAQAYLPNSGSTYDRCTNTLTANGVNTTFIQKKGILNLDTFPSCVEVDNKWKVCARCSNNKITVCNYGTEFVILNYGNLTATNQFVNVLPVFPLNVILAPSENYTLPFESCVYAGRPAAVLTI